MDISPKSRDIRDKMNVLCIWIAVLVLVLLSLSSIIYVVLIGGLHPDLLAGVPSTVIGYAVPIALCFIMIVSNWIKRGKWLPVVLSYLVFWYIVYDIIFYYSTTIKNRLVRCTYEFFIPSTQKETYNMYDAYNNPFICYNILCYFLPQIIYQ